MICVTSVPVYLCAAIYVTLANTIEELAPELSLIQAIGGALTTVSEGTSAAGINVALTGLALQVLTICVFCGLMADYMGRYVRSSRGERRPSLLFKQFFAFLSTAIVLITVRCIYRLVELHQGYRGKLVQDEGLFIAFEGALVLAAAYALALGHPGRIFGQAKPVDETAPSGSVKLHDMPLMGDRA
ncbi:hypothetical protein NLG97_g4708 [Lecanicillium saksenae]|uniref:Uncharacterized protein n=1 Tax=Lecanicillium saksenae TaxID=468837 RepID=A0ACC1QXM9_9HYPO|nr:hypothetical protein NLG97_g4708 [Lecanicillium saksenae]